MTARGKEEGLEAVQQKAESFGQEDGEAKELARQVENLRNDLAELGNTVRALALEGSASAQRTVRETTGKLARRGQDLAEEVRTTGQKAVDYGSEVLKDKYSELETTVRRHPTTAVALALGVGYLIGLLSRNRS